VLDTFSIKIKIKVTLKMKINISERLCFIAVYELPMD
jgi:hypothetical protein